MGAKHGTLKDLHLVHDPDPSTTADRVEKWMAKYIQFLEEFKKDAPPDWKESDPGGEDQLPSITEMSHCNSLDGSSNGKDGTGDDMNESRQSSFRNGGRMPSNVGMMSRIGTQGSGGLASPSSALQDLDNVRNPIPEEEEIRPPSKGFSCFSWTKKKGQANIPIKLNGNTNLASLRAVKATTAQVSSQDLREFSGHNNAVSAL
mmetsp:Transcript_37019/g.87133  ORF Transcript_37019/g.87133 Transcript_37019/m.87133 type:complete len:203 (+) Transcript_37019:57-665(+)